MGKRKGAKGGKKGPTTSKPKTAEASAGQDLRDYNDSYEYILDKNQQQARKRAGRRGGRVRVEWKQGPPETRSFPPPCRPHPRPTPPPARPAVAGGRVRSRP